MSIGANRGQSASNHSTAGLGGSPNLTPQTSKASEVTQYQKHMQLRVVYQDVPQGGRSRLVPGVILDAARMPRLGANCAQVSSS